MKSIGIDIGTYSIKVAEVVTSGKNVSIRSLAEFPLNSDPNADNQIAVLETLRNIASAHDPNSTTFVFAIGQDKVTTRQRFFPFSERKKIVKSLPFELEEEIPFDISNAIFEAKYIRQMDNITEVIACATPKTRVESVLQVAHDAGIEPQIISMESSAHANCVEGWYSDIPKEKPTAPSTAEEGTKPAPDDASLLVDIGHRKTIVSIFRRGRMMATRTISWGGKNLIEAIAKKYGVLYQEGLRETQAKAFILISPDGASRDQIVFSDTIAESFNEMIKELKLTMMEISTDYNVFFSSIQLTGGGSRVRNLNAHITQALEIPCNYFDPFSVFPSIGFEKTQVIMSGSSIAVGLAIEGIKRAKNPAVNFRKMEFALQSASWDLFWEKWQHTAQIAGVGLAAFLVYAVIIDTVSLNLADRSEEALRKVASNVLNKKSVRTTEVEGYIREQNRQIENQAKLAGLMGMNSTLDIIKKLSQALPEKSIDILRLDVDKQILNIEGTFKDPSKKNNLENGLKSISFKGKINKKVPLKAVGPSGFSYEIEVDRNIKGKD
ncbi:MAG: hypothetical protein A4S09_08330 [Proteobacteria bacterium SG_bin7]|nr:MAG: hypothetical protein A4S09_08330 [Proteobacteria bacterium SG_bin7]